MNDKEMPAAEPAEDKLVDEVVKRLLDRADAQVRPCWVRAGC